MYRCTAFFHERFPLSSEVKSRLFIRIIIFLILFTLSVLVLLPIQRRIDEYSERLQQQTVERLEEAIGRDISYRSISPSILLFLEMRGIRIERRGDGRNLEIETIRVHYSLIQLVRGNVAKAVDTIRIIDSSLQFDTGKDAGLISELQDMLAANDTAANTEPPGLVVSGENLSIRYITGQGTFEVEDLFFTAEYDRERERYGVEGRGVLQGQFDEAFSVGNFELTEAQSRFSFQSSAATSFDQLNARLTFQEFDSNLLRFSGLTVELTRDRERTVIRKIEDSSPWDLQFIIDQQKETVTGTLEAQDFVPADNIKAEPGFGPYAEWLGTVISGEAQFTADLEGRLQTYQGDLSLEMDNSSLPEPLSVELVADGTQESLNFERLFVTGPSGSAVFNGSLSLESYMPKGSLNLRSFRWNNYRVSGSFAVDSSGDELFVSSRRVVFNSLQLHDFNASLQVDPSEPTFVFEAAVPSAGAAALPESAGSPQPTPKGTVSGQGSYDRTGGGFLDITMLLEKVAVRPVVRAASPEGTPEGVSLAGLEATSELYFSTDFERYSFSLLPLQVDSAEDEFSFQAAISGNNESVLVEQMTLTAGDRSFEGSLQVSRLQREGISFQAQISHRAVAYTVEGSYRRPSTILIKGNHGLRATVFLREEASTFSVRASSFPLPLGEENTELTLHASGSFSSPQRWRLNARELRADSLPGFKQNNSLSMSLQADPETIRASRIVYRDDLSTLRGEAEMRSIRLNPLKGNLWIRLANEAGNESYRGILSLGREELRGNLEVNGFPLPRLRELPVQGALHANAAVTGTLDEPRVNYTLRLENAQYNAASIAFSGSGVASPDSLVMNDIQAEYRNHILNDGDINIKIPSGAFTLNGQYRGILRNRTSRARIRCNGSIADLDTLSELPQTAEKNIEAEVRLSDIILFEKDIEPWTLQFSKKETISVSGGPQEALEGTMQADGTFDFALRAPLPIRMQGSGTLREGILDMDLRNIWVEMKTLNNLGISAVDFRSGVIAGNLEIEGPSGDPEFFGDLILNNADLDIRYVSGTIRPFSTTMSVSGKTGTIEAVDVEVGNQTARVSGGLRLDRWTPNSIRFDTRTLSRKGVKMDYVIQKSGIIANGYARGSFTYAYEGNLNRIEGDLVINDLTVTMQDKEPPPVMQNSRYRVDLDIRTGTNVQFLWPRANFPILRAYLSTGQDLDIRYRSNPERYTIRGDVELRGGEIYYFQRNFYITEGAIHLNEDENAFNPLIELRARLREIDTTGRPVTIFFIVENEPLKTFTPRFESQPVLGTAEIMQLLGAQLFSQFSGERGDLTSALLLTGDVFSQFGIIRSFEQQMKEALGLDLFSIRTQMIQNVIVDRVLDQPLTEGTAGLSPAERYLDNTTLFLGKYLGNDLFLEGMVQLRRNPIIENDFNEGGLNVHMEIGFEWQTPLFLLNFSVNPDFGDPVQSIYNTSLGFSWDYSY